eukprot:CAMPEP_0204906360 /NCGR_PEP_ID=MMETSP1397-20131031/5936_1 /ASSEMBLY_ACC=CAM_ASM_000891 /TAXON_ID=49980 /ORGANISM="Climacostomum Climacostomum virens, Strain Stock W-24" /LENGTH=280 /DNA_ID=CAMNT_0052075349 /DNA_START=74 /DNA_END=916 /DNA_ORIENTATION=-
MPKDCILRLHYEKLSSELVSICCDSCLMNLKANSVVTATVKFTSSSNEAKLDEGTLLMYGEYDLSLLDGSFRADTLIQTPFIKCLASKLLEVIEHAPFDIEDPDLPNPQDELLRMVVLWPKAKEFEAGSSPADLFLADMIVKDHAISYFSRMKTVLENCTHLNTWSRKEIKRKYNLSQVDPTLFLHCHGSRTKPGFERMFLSGEQKEQILDDYESGRIDIDMIRNKYCVSDSRFHKWRKARKDGRTMKDFALEEFVSLPMKAAWQELFAEMQIGEGRRLN